MFPNKNLLLAQRPSTPHQTRTSQNNMTRIAQWGFHRLIVQFNREPKKTARSLNLANPIQVQARGPPSSHLIQCLPPEKRNGSSSFAASAGWFSTASSFIYFPAIPFLANDLDVDIQKINLTVTSYLVVSGIFPSLIGGAADRYGRRPLLVAAVGLYIAVNIGLAIQRDFRALLTLRILQSAAVPGWF